MGLAPTRINVKRIGPHRCLHLPVVVVCSGLDIKMTNKEGQDRDHGWTGYALPGMQQDLARQIAALNKPVVVRTAPCRNRVVLAQSVFQSPHLAQTLLVHGASWSIPPLALWLQASWGLFMCLF